MGRWKTPEIDYSNEWHIRRAQRFHRMMPSTYTNLHAHIVFATKHRQTLINPSWTGDLHAYLGGCLKHANAVPLEIGGYRDHVHLLIGFKPTHRLSDLLCDIKSASSKWVHDEIGIRLFGWQEGYAAISVGGNDLDGLRKYIRTQEEHHRTRTFLEEYEELLKEMGMVLDKRYLP